LKILVDMNLSPSWVDRLAAEGFDAVHWSEIGDPRAADSDLLAWAKSRGYVVLTHDLDFGSILAATSAAGPSVVQVRAQDVTPAHLASTLIAALRQFQAQLDAGVLMSIDETSSRVHILPLKA
jgi:predicted nuclease of predicted toxin-antitoxin system